MPLSPVVAGKGLAAWVFAWGTCRRRRTLVGRRGVGLGVSEQLIGGHRLAAVGASMLDGPSVADQAERAGVDPVDEGSVGDVVHQVAPVLRRVRCSPSWCSSRCRSSAFWLRS